MSYSRSYSETITVSGSKTVNVSYPASQNGGTTSATVHYTEYVPVNVNICMWILTLLTVALISAIHM